MLFKEKMFSTFLLVTCQFLLLLVKVSREGGVTDDKKGYKPYLADNANYCPRGYEHSRATFPRYHSGTRNNYFKLQLHCNYRIEVGTVLI